VWVFSFKLNTDSFVRSIYYNNMFACILKKNVFSKIINWDIKGNFKGIFINTL